MNRRSFLLSSAAAALHRSCFSTSAVSQNSATMDDGSTKNALSADPLRPQYHLLPQAGGVGDPCAPRFFQGKYHVFFHGSFGGRGWHHAMSTDLVHWQHMPIALAPTDGGYDAYGTFTGGVLPGGEGASVVYTAVTKVPRNRKLSAQKASAKCKPSRLPWTETFAHGKSVRSPSSILRPRAFRSQDFAIRLHGKMGIPGTYASARAFRRSEEPCCSIVRPIR